MAEVNAEMKFRLGVDDQTKGVFEQLGAKMKTLEGSTTKLSSSFTSLGIAGASIYTAYQAWSYFMEGIAKYEAEAEVVNLMASRLQSIGINAEAATPKVKDFADQLEKLGQDGEQTIASVGQISLKTKDLSSAMNLTKMAADLSSSGYGTLADNADRITRILTGGRGATAAMREYGIVMEGTHTSAEMLSAVNEKITRTSEEYATTVQGKNAILKNDFDNFQKQLGSFGSFVKTDLVVSFEDFFSKTLGMGEDWGKSMSKVFFTVQQGFESGLATLIAGVTAPSDDKLKKMGYKDYQDYISSVTKYINQNYDTESVSKKFDEMWKSISGENASGVTGGSAATDLSDDLEAAAEKAQSAFTDIAKAAVSSLEEQETAIAKLRKQITDLDSDMQDQIDKSNKSYNDSVVSLAKSSKDKIDSIDKQIKSEKESMSNGWRDRVAELEAEKAKEQSIIDRANGEVSNLNDQMNQDDLTVLENKHAAELAEIKKSNEEKKKEYEDDINSRLQFIITAYQTLMSSDFFSKSTDTSESFLRAIGASSTQNVFNFNEVVAGDDGVKKLVDTVISALNRTAQLKGYAGQ